MHCFYNRNSVFKFLAHLTHACVYQQQKILATNWLMSVINMKNIINAQESLKCPEFLRLVYERKFKKVFTSLIVILKVYMTLPISSCEPESNFSDLSIIKNKY